MMAQFHSPESLPVRTLRALTAGLRLTLLLR